MRSLGRAVGVDARAVAVGHAPAAERDAVVGGALRVHVDVGDVAEGLAAVPADLRPRTRPAAARSTIIDEFIGSHVRCSPRRSAVKPSVARSTCVARTVPRSVTARPGAISVTCVCSWIGDAEPLDGRGEAAHELRRVDARAVRVPHAAERAGDADTRCRGLSGIQSARTSVCGHDCSACRDRPQARELRGRAGDAELAALDDVGVDALAGGDGDDLVDGLVERALLGDRGVAAVGCSA